jgi:Transposase
MIGLDIGRNSAVVCAMAERPVDLVDYIRKYKPIALSASPESIEQLCSMGDIFALEPTGVYHRWWVAQLEAKGKQVLLIPGIRVRNHAHENGVTSKGDKEDAAAIASYTISNLERSNLRAFQSGAGNEIRDLRFGLLNAQTNRTRLICQLKARLSIEATELMQFKATERSWGASSPNCWEKLKSIPQLSWHSREDIEQIIYWNQRELRIELELDALFQQPEYQIYLTRLEPWGFSPRQITPIIGALHPIEQFLSEDGERVIERIHTATGSRVKLDRTLRGIHRSLGYGRIKIQSGDKWAWKRTGDRTVLAALYIWLEMKVVIRRTPSAARIAGVWEAPPEFATTKKRKAWIEEHNFRSFCLKVEPKCETVKPIPRDRQRVGYMPWKDAALIEQVCGYSGCKERVAQLQLYYEFAFFEINKHDRILKTLPYMIRLMSEDLVRH